MAFLVTLCLVSMAGAALSSVVKTSQTTDAGKFELLILHNNDMHARFEQTSQLSGACTAADRDAGKCYGGFPRVATVVKEARAAAAAGDGPPVLYLNAGDTYTGTAWFTIYKWKIAAEFINALQPDAVSLGNHEFDNAVDGLVPFIKNVSTPVLAANLILDKVPEMSELNNLKKSTVLDVNGVSIGVIGYLTPETMYLAPKNDVQYEDEITAIRREVEILKKQNINVLIALGHSGYIKDLEIAENVDDIDLVIGGHSNTFLTNDETEEKPETRQGPYPKIVVQKSGRKVPVVQAYAYTKYLGKLHLVIDGNGEITEVDGNPILLDNSVQRDPEVLKLVMKYQDEMNHISKEVVGRSEVPLDGQQCRLRECTMGNVIADSVLQYVQKHESVLDLCVNIAVIQGGRIRASIDHPGSPLNLTKGDWLTVLPFSDSLTVVSMNGSILTQALEHSVDTWRTVDSTGQFMQVSGIEVVYDLTKNPGNRIVTAKAVNSKCESRELKAIEPNEEYNIVMPSFLADGGDGYTIFEQLNKKVLHYNDIACVIDYLSQFDVIKPKIENRIQIINAESLRSTGNHASKSHIPSSIIYLLLIVVISLS